MDSFAAIIALWGPKPSAYAKAIGVPPLQARAWKARNSIPEGYWRKTVAAAEARAAAGDEAFASVTYELLARLAEQRLDRPGTVAA